jgi:MFS transporter, CP family, cyanate transporter
MHAIDKNCLVTPERHRTCNETANNSEHWNEPQRTLPSWLAISAIVLVAVDLRPSIVSIGPILASIRTEFGLSHAGASLLTAIPALLMGSLALPTPWLSRRFGRDNVLIWALAVLCISTIGRAFAHSTSILLLTTVGVGTGVAIAGSLIGGFIKAQFPTRTAMLMGIYATALSFGSTVAAGITGQIAQGVSNGWRFATGIWSLLGILALIGWVVVMFCERKLKLVMRARHASFVRLPLGNTTAWIIAIFFGFNNFLFYALIAWVAPIFHELGSSISFAGLLLASFTGAFMLGNLIFGALSKSHDRRGWLAACSLLASLGLLGFALVPRSVSFLCVPIAALGLGGTFTLGMTLPLDNAESVETANVWNAFTMTVGYLMAAGGPLLVGMLRDATGSYQLPMWLLVTLSVLMLALTPLLSPHRRVAVAACKNEAA